MTLCWFQNRVQGSASYSQLDACFMLIKFYQNTTIANCVWLQGTFVLTWK